MRILHTSDWHLGQTLHQFERSHEHAKFLGWLLDTLVGEQIDGLLIAGDVFDNSNPSAASQAQFYGFLTEARRRVAHLKIVVTAGNHDSPGRLEAPAPFLSLLDACVVGQTTRDGGDIALDRLVVPLADRDGVVAAWCIAMPFLRPGDVPRIEGAADPYTAGIAALYRQAFEHACSKRTPGQAVIAIGHCHLTSAKVSEDSERRIIIGGAEALSADVFDAQMAYVALGHLHLARRVHALVLAMATVLHQAARHADDLVALQARADAEVVATACSGRAVVQAQTTPTRRTLLFIDPVTGADKPIDVAWQSALALRVTTERPRPCGYWLAPGQPAAIEALVALGVQVHRVVEPTPLQTESWVELARGEVTRPDVRGSVADGHRTLLRLVVDLKPEPMDAPAGSHYVPLDQPLANLVIAALEPDSPNSYLANRLIERLDAVRRVMARPAGPWLVREPVREPVRQPARE